MVLSEPRVRAFLLAVLAVLLAVPASAQAATTGGGVAFPGTPEVQTATCATGEQWRCAPGEELTVEGDELQSVTAVAFVGRRGGRDDRRARPVVATQDKLVVVVPDGARSGRLRVRTLGTVARTTRAVRIGRERRTAAVGSDDASSSGAMTFPIRGKHDMGQSETNAFGGGRGHGGHDLFADCGTPLVAVTSGVVQAVAYHSAAGYYLVLRDSSGASYAYMHMRSAATHAVGDEIEVGETVGRVGATGRATGCHLHFEQWTAPGWYTGGRAIDPLPLLERLETRSHSHG